MIVNDTAQTTYTQVTKNIKSITQTEAISFEIKFDKDIDPLSISFKDYQQLSQEDLNTIFGKGSAREYQASSLKSAAQFTDDENLNKVFFDNKLNEIKNGGDFTMMSSLSMMIANPLDTEELNRMFDPDNIGMFNLTDEQLQEPFWQKVLSKGKDGIIPPQVENKDSIDLNNSKQLLEYFRNIREFFDDVVDVEGHKHYYDEERMFEVVDDILKSYDGKIEQNNGLLHELTKNTKPNPLENIE